MSANTTIEWTDRTWNPVTGCTKVSPGCDNCYAETIAERFRGQAAFPNGFDVQVRSANTVTAPLRWRKPARVFVNSMSDLFHTDVDRIYLQDFFGVMAATPQHTYQILTKRHGRMHTLINDPNFAHMVRHRAEGYGRPATAGWTWPLPNVWLGVSVENQKWADIRIPSLLDTPAAVRFLSCEPLLGPVDLTRIAAGSKQQPDMVFDALGQRYGVPGRWQAATAARVDWVIVGGESGHGARPMSPDWARTLRDQCQQAGVPFFFKQLGTVAARQLGVPGKGTDLDQIPADLRIRESANV